MCRQLVVTNSELETILLTAESNELHIISIYSNTIVWPKRLCVHVFSDNSWDQYFTAIPLLSFETASVEVLLDSSVFQVFKTIVV